MKDEPMNIQDDTPETRDMWHSFYEGGGQEDEIFVLCRKLERERDQARERLNKLSNAASVLWEEHKAFGEDMHDTEGVDYLGSDSEGHAMMRALVDETLASVSQRNADETADEQRDRSALNDSALAPPPQRLASK